MAGLNTHGGFKNLRYCSKRWEFLRHKILALICYFGLCRMADIAYLAWDDIKMESNGVNVTIKRSKTPTASASQVFFIPQTDELMFSHCSVFIKVSLVEMVVFGGNF